MFKIKYKWRIDHLYFIFYRVFYKPAYEIVHERHLLDISGNQLSLQLFKIFIRCRSIAFLELLILRVKRFWDLIDTCSEIPISKGENISSSTHNDFFY